MNIYYVEEGTNRVVTRYASGSRNVVLPDGRKLATVPAESTPAWRLFREGVAEPEPGDEHHRNQMVLTFNPTSERVDVSWQSTPIDISTLYSLKTRELEQFAQANYYGGTPVPKNGNPSEFWPVPTDEQTQTRLLFIFAKWKINGPGPPSPWPGDFSFRLMDGTFIRQVNEARFEALIDAVFTHVEASAERFDIVAEQLENTYDNGNGDWSALAAIDVTAGFPPNPDLDL